MRNSRFGRHLPKVMSLCVLAAMSMPAHSLSLDTKEALTFGIYTTVSPTISQESNKFTYVYGDPAIYGASGTIAQVLADQDRQDSDERARLTNTNRASAEIYVSQALTKTLSFGGSTLLQFNPDGNNHWGNPWGLTLRAKNLGNIAIGDLWTRLRVGQTGADDVLSSSGTNVRVDITRIPGVTLTAYHMLTAAKDVEDRRDSGLHKSNGVSAAYEYSFAPRRTLKVAAGVAKSEGHPDPFYVNTARTAEAKMASVSYQHQDVKLAFDFGEKEEEFNGAWFGKVDTDVMGVQLDYEITPRLTTTLNYSRKTSDNSQPVELSHLTSWGRGVSETLFFDKVEQNRLGASVKYQLYKGVSLVGSAEQTKTRNYLTSGEFSKREQLKYNAGVRFSF